MQNPEKTPEPGSRHTISEGRIAVRTDISEEDAIRRIAHEGTCADYVDIANAVRERFGLHVGAGRVEEVIMAMKQETPSPPVPWLKNAGIKLAGDLRQTTEPGSHPQQPPEITSVDAAPPRQDVLKFVESMGGFDAARAAIADLEHSIRNLLK
jgi:hypothetical protein